MKIIEHKTFDEERALYGMRDIDVARYRCEVVIIRWTC